MTASMNITYVDGVMIKKCVWVYSLKQLNESNLHMYIFDQSSKGQYWVCISLSRMGHTSNTCPVNLWVFSKYVQKSKSKI